MLRKLKSEWAGLIHIHPILRIFQVCSIDNSGIRLIPKKERKHDQSCILLQMALNPIGTHDGQSQNFWGYGILKPLKVIISNNC